MSVAVLVTARAHDQQYDWTTSEIAAQKDGLEPAIVDVIRQRKSPAGLGEKDVGVGCHGTRCGSDQRS
jgi:hypothetical protein